MKYENKKSQYYSLLRLELLKYIPDENKIVLDIGCGTGKNLDYLKSKNMETWGVELVEKYANEAKEAGHKIFIGTIEDNINNLPDNYFDTILMFDVLEHLNFPEDVLKKIKLKLKNKGILLSSIPNVRYWSNLFNLLVHKDWEYVESGILDYTHFRFFTKKSIKRMFYNCGYDIKIHKGINSVKWWKYILIDIFTLGLFRDAKYPQFLTVVKYKN